MTVEFSEAIAANDMKVSRRIYEDMSIEGEGHFLTLAQGRVHTKIHTRFSQKLLCRSEPNFV